MRIAGKHFSPKAFIANSAILAVLGLCSFAPTHAYAAPDPIAPSAPVSVAAPSAAPVASAPAPAATAVPGPSLVGTANAAPSPSAVQDGAGAVNAAFQVPQAPKSEGEDIAKALSAMEDKITDNAKSVVKRLDTADTTTISDLNAARQTVTRIEAMIDVEKRLGELEKLRNERNSRSLAATMPIPAGFAGAIPASALQPLPRPGASAAAMPDSPEAAPVMHFGSGRPEIVRISGTEGKYVAVLKLPDGEKKSVKVGDKVSGRGTVRSITSSSVEVADKGTSYTLRVKNVDAIYSVMR